MKRHKTILSAALIALVFSTASPGQNSTSNVADLREPAQTQPSNVPVTAIWDYRAETETLLVHLTNHSGKDIVGYFISVRRRLPDGTLDKSGYSAQLNEQMLTLASIQMSKDPAAYQRRLEESGIGLFNAGTTSEISVANIASPDVNVTADVVFYADGTFDEQNEEQFKRMLGRRQSQLLAMKKVNEIVRSALADTANDHPAQTAITELAKAASEAMAHNPDSSYDTESGEVSFLQAGISNMRMVQRTAAESIGAPTEKDKTERERLTTFVEKQEKEVELITPQCHLEISLKK